MASNNKKSLLGSPHISHKFPAVKRSSIANSSSFFQTQSDTVAWLRSMKIKNFMLEEDLSVSVQGDVDISFQKLSAIPIQFSHIKGNFTCSENMLTSLQGAPRVVEGYFDCANNRLVSLEYGPEMVGQHYDCQNNFLKSLSFAPRDIPGAFFAQHNRLTDLKGVPHSIGALFDVSNNPLKTFEEAPFKVIGDFYFINTKIKSIAQLQTKISASSALVFNKEIKELKGFGYFNNAGNWIVPEVELSLVRQILKDKKTLSQLPEMIKKASENTNTQFLIKKVRKL